MRRSLVGGLILSLAWLAPAASAGEVIATASPSAAAAANKAPAAFLDRPRVIAETPAAGPLLPVSYQEPIPGPTRPEPSPYAPLLASPDRGEGPAVGTSTFAAERVGFAAPEVPKVAPTPAGDAPVGAPMLPDPLAVSGGALENPCADPGASLAGGELPPAEAAGLASRFYGSAEYLTWWTRSAHVPPLASTSTDPFANGILAPSAMFPTTSTSRVLFAGPLEHDPQQGARFRAGYWFDTCKPFAIEGSFFFLSPRSDRFFAGSDGTTVLARPFFDLNDGREFSQLVASPFTSSGTISVEAPSRLFGADLNLRCPLCCYDGCQGGLKVDLLAGGRYLSLREGLYITEQGMNFPNTAFADPGQAFRIDDRFDTTNHFYGGQLGLQTELQRGRFFVDLRGLVALGDSHEVLNVNGGAIAVNTNPALIASQGMIVRQPGGLLALPGANIGRFSRDQFAAVPELTFNVGYQVTDNLRAFVGYNFLYWSSVLRPGDQIDRRLDITRIPLNFAPAGTLPTGLGNPLPLLKGTDFWAQGINVGLQFRY